MSLRGVLEVMFSLGMQAKEWRMAMNEQATWLSTMLLLLLLPACLLAEMEVPCTRAAGVACGNSHEQGDCADCST